MSKRLTDTEIWDKDWFMNLSHKHKLFVRFLFDKCDVAGIWDINFKLASFYIGEEINDKDLSVLGEHLIRLSDKKIIIKDFIPFQYGVLSEASNPHKKVIELLKKNSLYEGYLKGTLTVQDKDKDKDKEIGRVKVEKFDSKIFDEIISYLNKKTNSSYRANSENTKSFITARLNQGFTIEDFKKVIDNKTSKWLTDPKFSEFLRPKTLFGPNFESYLNEKGGSSNVSYPEVRD